MNNRKPVFSKNFGFSDDSELVNLDDLLENEGPDSLNIPPSSTLGGEAPWTRHIRKTRPGNENNDSDFMPWLKDTNVGHINESADFSDESNIDTDDNNAAITSFMNKHSAPGQISRPTISKAKPQTRAMNVDQFSGRLVNDKSKVTPRQSNMTRINVSRSQWKDTPDNWENSPIASVVSVAGIGDVEHENDVRSGRSRIRSATSVTSIGSSRPRSGDVNLREVVPDI